MKKQRIVIAVILLVLLSGCGAEAMRDPIMTGNLVLEERKPPKVVITSEKASYQMQQGNYDWQVEGEKEGEVMATIACGLSPGEMLKEKELTGISKTETLVLQFDKEPDRYHIYGWYGDNAKMKVEKLEDLRGEEPVAIEVMAYYPQGESSYVLPVIFK